MKNMTVTQIQAEVLDEVLAPTVPKAIKSLCGLPQTVIAYGQCAGCYKRLEAVMYAELDPATDENGNAPLIDEHGYLTYCENCYLQVAPF